MLTKILAALNAYPPVARRIRHADTVLGIGIGDQRWCFALKAGQVSPSDAEPAFAVHIDEAAWADFKEPVPPPGANDFSAMTESGRARTDGDQILLFQYNWVVRDVLAALAGKDFGR